MADDPERSPLLSGEEDDSSIDVFSLVRSVHQLIKDDIDTTLSWDQLNAPDVTFNLTRPSIARLSDPLNPAILYALLVNRMHFLRLAEHDLSYASVQLTRAEFAELLATKLVRRFAHDDVGLVGGLVAEWDALQGAPDELLHPNAHEDLTDGRRSTLEIAILSLSKRFLATPLLQRAIALIHSGAVCFASRSVPGRALLQDGYASRHVRGRRGRRVWGFEGAGKGRGWWAVVERLGVPKWREVVELVNFALIIGTFVLCIQNRQLDRLNASEVAFVAVALGFALDEFAATREHGVVFYTQSLFNGFDLSFLVVFFAYLGLRTHGLWAADEVLSGWAFDVLACGAAILFPRLAFTVLKGNVVIIALQQMLRDFCLFMGLALVCFSGIFFALAVLGQETWSKKSIAWLMAQIWFGSSYLSFQNSASFHPIFGPLLLISYAALSNTLLVTILISILSNRYALVSAAAREEQLFQSAIRTVGGVKADAIFSFVVPLNVPAVLVLWPLSFVLPPKALHLATKAFVCLASWPLLLVISGWERWTKSGTDPSSLHARAGSLVDNVVGALGGGGDWVDVVFSDDGPDPRPAAAALPTDPTGGRVRRRGGLNASEVLLERRSEELEAEISAGEGGGEGGRKGGSGWRSPPQSTTTTADKGKVVEQAEPPAAGRRLTSPLARLFGRGQVVVAEPAAIIAHQPSEASLSAVNGETLLHELQELKERQERIEGMLAVLTKGMRSDSM